MKIGAQTIEKLKDSNLEFQNCFISAGLDRAR